MTPAIEGTDSPHDGEQVAPANWALRDVVIGVALLLFIRNLPEFFGRDALARLPTWFLLGVVALLPQLFFLAYPLIVARRRGIADIFRMPKDDAEKGMKEVLIAVGVNGGLVVALAVTSTIVSFVRPGTELTPEIIERAAVAPSVAFVIFIVVTAALVAPVCEEVFFRGFLQAALRSRMPVAVAVLLQCTIFAVLHTFGAVHSVIAFVLGVVLTVVYEWRKTLLTPILVHAGNNVIASLGFVALVYLNANCPALGVFGHDHPQGYQVDKLVAGAGAAKSGVVEGDVITKLNGQPVTGYRQLINLLRLHKVGETVTVGILRDGEIQEIKVVLEKRPSSP